MSWIFGILRKTNRPLYPGKNITHLKAKINSRLRQKITILQAEPDIKIVFTNIIKRKIPAGWFAEPEFLTKKMRFA